MSIWYPRIIEPPKRPRTMGEAPKLRSLRSVASKMGGARVKVAESGERRRRSQDPVGWPNGWTVYYRTHDTLSGRQYSRAKRNLNSIALHTP